MLGDLFDAWIGDDQLREPLAERVALGLRGVANAGVPVGILTGNRDFLLGERFATVAGATLLPEQIVDRPRGNADAAAARRRAVHRRRRLISAFAR